MRWREHRPIGTRGFEHRVICAVRAVSHMVTREAAGVAVFHNFGSGAPPDGAVSLSFSFGEYSGGVALDHQPPPISSGCRSYPAHGAGPSLAHITLAMSLWRSVSRLLFQHVTQTRAVYSLASARHHHHLQCSIGSSRLQREPGEPGEAGEISVGVIMLCVSTPPRSFTMLAAARAKSGLAHTVGIDS